MATITLDTPLTGPSPLTEAQIVSGIMARNPARPDFTREVVRLVVRKCAAINLRGDVWVADAALETGNFSSPIYRQYGNIGGLGVFDDGTNVGGSFTTPEIAASAFVAHAMAYCYGRALPAGEGWIRYDPRWSAAIDRVTRLGTTTLVRHLGNGNWATNPTHAADLVSRYNVLFASFSLPTEDPDMSIPYPAPPLEIAITPYNNANRPKLEMASPSYITVHEVGNQSPGADEVMHKIFVHNGGGPAQVSFHFVVGPTRAIQLIPLDEAAWHASDGYNGTGNRDSVAIETIQIGDFNRTLWNLAWLINEIATNPGRFYANRARQWDFSINKIKQHHDWAPDGKNCPEFIRNRGLWPELMRRVDAWHAAGQPAPEPEPTPEPEPQPEPAKHTLPKGMSVQLARRLFGGYVAPWDGTVFAFDLDEAPSQVWLARGKRSVPDGGSWADGNWPDLNVVIRRGDGGQVWVWSDGSTYERQAPQRDAA